MRRRFTFFFRLSDEIVAKFLECRVERLWPSVLTLAVVVITTWRRISLWSCLVYETACLLIVIVQTLTLNTRNLACFLYNFIYFLSHRPLSLRTVIVLIGVSDFITGDVIEVIVVLQVICQTPFISKGRYGMVSHWCVRFHIAEPVFILRSYGKCLFSNFKFLSWIDRAHFRWFLSHHWCWRLTTLLICMSFTARRCVFNISGYDTFLIGVVDLVHVDCQVSILHAILSCSTLEVRREAFIIWDNFLSSESFFLQGQAVVWFRFEARHVSESLVWAFCRWLLFLSGLRAEALHEEFSNPCNWIVNIATTTVLQFYLLIALVSVMGSDRLAALRLLHRIVLKGGSW